MERIVKTAPGAAGILGAGAEGATPVRAGEGAVAPLEKRGAGSWLRAGVRIVRNAAVAVALMAMVPIALVGLGGDQMWEQAQFGSSIRSKTAIAERSRALMLPRDASITPMQAGLAYAALMPAREYAAIPLRELSQRPERTWESLELTKAMFPTARPDMYARAPSTSGILEAVAKGFSREETEYLRAIATAPVWREYEIVARAPSADLVGGMVRFPLPADAQWEKLPIARFAATKDLAYASVSRAAYHLSQGRRDSAESALRAIASVGFTMIDNGTNLMDQLVGNVIVGIGRESLRRFYEVTGDPRVSLPAVTAVPTSFVTLESGATIRGLSVDELRRRVIARATDPATPRGERFETLRMLSLSSCSSVRELMFGPRADVLAATESARRMLGRFESERQLARLAAQPVILDAGAIANNPIDRMLVSIATVPAMVLNRPQLATCSLITSQAFLGR